MKILIIFFSLNNLIVFSQKNTIWLGHSLTKISQDSFSFDKPSFKKIRTIGAGFSILIERELLKSEVSSIIYGVELSSVRQAFYLNGFSNYFTNTTLKIPVLYGFKYMLTNKTKAIIQLGLNLQTNFSGNVTTFVWNNSTELKVTTIGGVFPLVHFDFGIEQQLKKKKFRISIGANKGFVNIAEITYKTTSPDISINSFFDGSFFEVKFNWQLN